MASTLIVMGHGTVVLGAPMAVELFFIISGFVMMHATQNGLEQYFVKRLIRIVPLYWIVNFTFAGLALVTSSIVFSVPFFIKSLFFIARVPFFTVGWTLNYEMWFYLLFWVCSKISRKHRGLIALSACLVWYLYELRKFSGPSINSFPFVQPALILGILAYYCWGYLRTKPLNGLHKALLGSLITVSALFVHSHLADRLMWDMERGTWSILRAAVCGIPAFLIFMSVLLLVRRDRSKPVKVLAYVGNISYSLYLWHIVVQTVLVGIFGRLGYVIVPPSTVPFMLLNLTLSLIAAHFSYKYLEQPVSRYLKDWLINRKSAAVSAV